MGDYEVGSLAGEDVQCVVGVNSRPVVDGPRYEAGIGSTLAGNALAAVMIAYCLWPAVELATDKFVDVILHARKSLGLDSFI